MSVVITDGRVSFQHDGISISHVVPEAMDGGALGAIRTGDWVYLDLARGELQVIADTNNHHGYKVIPAKEILSRPDLKKRVHELERRRGELLPSFRTLLEQVTSADSGVSPAGS
jgi:dihydroxyacid dehydratase/phosphogluconate dehydratase